jgi:hypothetical protein
LHQRTLSLSTVSPRPVTARAVHANPADALWRGLFQSTSRFRAQLPKRLMWINETGCDERALFQPGRPHETSWMEARAFGCCRFRRWKPGLGRVAKRQCPFGKIHRRRRRDFGIDDGRRGGKQSRPSCFLRCRPLLRSQVYRAWRRGVGAEQGRHGGRNSDRAARYRCDKPHGWATHCHELNKAIADQVTASPDDRGRHLDPEMRAARA